MIPIVRGNEPAALAPIRVTELAKLRALGRPIVSDDIGGYRIVAESLWRIQHFKCCYCEGKVTVRYNDVEHYRPKARADRRPGCQRVHGYWWLAFSWDNLLFACPACNRSSKNDQFPLEIGSISLDAESEPPGGEHALLLDPGSGINPVEHIEYVQCAIGDSQPVSYWWARPRGQSQLGKVTIDVCDLNNLEFRELRNDHYRNQVSPQIVALKSALADNDILALRKEFARACGLLRPACPYVALSYDALRSSVPQDHLYAAIGERWPLPGAVGR